MAFFGWLVCFFWACDCVTVHEPFRSRLLFERSNDGQTFLLSSKKRSSAKASEKPTQQRSAGGGSSSRWRAEKTVAWLSAAALLVGWLFVALLRLASQAGQAASNQQPID